MSLETPSFDAGYASHQLISDAPHQWEGLVWWAMPFLGMQGNVLYDLVGKYPGSLINVDPDTAWAPQARMGEAGWGLTLDGTTSYVDLVETDLFDFPDTTFTISLWFNTTGAVHNGYLLNKRDVAGTSSGWFLRADAAGTLTARLMDGAATVAAERTSVGVYNDGLWHLATIVFITDTVVGANNDIILYVDGRPDFGGNAASGNPYLPSTVSVKCGVQADLQANTYFPGAIDDLRIYNRVLADQEVWDLYTDPYGMARAPEQIDVQMHAINYLTRMAMT